MSARLHAAGLANWWLPAEYGGAGASLRDSVDIVSELSYGDAGFAFTSFLSILGTTMVRLFGERRAGQAAPRIARPPRWLLRDPGQRARGRQRAGPDHHHVRRQGRPDRAQRPEGVLHQHRLGRVPGGDGAPQADDGEFGAVLVPRDTPGIDVDKRWDVIGLRASGTYQVSLADCRVPAANALRGNGLRLLEVGLNASRILIATTALGIARRVRDVCMEYAKAKRVKGALLANNAVFAGKLGQLEMQIDVMRNQCLAAAGQYDAIADRHRALRAGTIRSALTAKMFCGQAGWQIASVGSEMFGGLATRDSLIGKLVRDLRYVGLVEGGDDVLRDLVFTRFVVPPTRRI